MTENLPIAPTRSEDGHVAPPPHNPHRLPGMGGCDCCFQGYTYGYPCKRSLLGCLHTRGIGGEAP